MMPCLSIRSAVMAIAAILISFAATAQPVALKLNSPGPPKSYLHLKVFEPWVEDVTRAAGGTLTIHLLTDLPSSDPLTFDNTMAAGTATSIGASAPAAPSRSPSSAASQASTNNTTFAVILSLSFCHLLNDMMQSLVPALYPILKQNYDLSFSQIGIITLAFQFTASMLQPVVGMYTDKKPQPYSLVLGMGFTLAGLALMSQASTYPVILFAAALIGIDRKSTRLNSSHRT